jgi:hypothetical protein
VHRDNLTVRYGSDYQPGVREPPGVRGRAFWGTRKKLNNGGKIPLLGYLFTVTKYKFEITASILIANILLI